MNKFFTTIGWKTYRGKWDKTEIKIDLMVIAIAFLFGFMAVCYG